MSDTMVRDAVASLRFKVLNEKVLGSLKEYHPCLPRKCPVPFNMNHEIAETMPTKSPCASSSRYSEFCTPVKRGSCHDRALGSKPMQCKQREHVLGEKVVNG